MCLDVDSRLLCLQTPEKAVNFNVNLDSEYDVVIDPATDSQDKF